MARTRNPAANQRIRQQDRVFQPHALRHLLELLVLRIRSEREKEIEILVLRHQLRVLRSLVRSFARAIGLCSRRSVGRCRGERGVVCGDTGDAPALASGAGGAPLDESTSA